MRGARSLLERATASWVVRRRLPGALGGARVFVSPGAAGLGVLVRPLAAVDPVLFRLAQTHVRPGAVVWDVGANVGLFTFAAAHRAGPTGQVFAFEPDPWVAGLLRRSCGLQPASSAPVHVADCAVSASNGERRLGLARRARASNALDGYGGTQMGGVMDSIVVPSATLDTLATRFPLPDVLKIDVEGAELEVLSASGTVLRQARPVILCEVSEAASDGATAILRSAGYRLFDGEAAEPLARELSRATWNTIALPPT